MTDVIFSTICLLLKKMTWCHCQQTLVSKYDQHSPIWPPFDHSSLEGYEHASFNAVFHSSVKIMNQFKGSIIHPDEMTVSNLKSNQ